MVELRPSIQVSIHQNAMKKNSMNRAIITIKIMRMRSLTMRMKPDSNVCPVSSVSSFSERCVLKGESTVSTTKMYSCVARNPKNPQREEMPSSRYPPMSGILDSKDTDSAMLRACQVTQK